MTSGGRNTTRLHWNRAGRKMDDTQGAPTKKQRVDGPDVSIPPLTSFPVQLDVIDPAVANLIRTAFKSLILQDADAARESTLPYMMSDFATVQQYSDAYAAAQLIYAEALLRQESIEEDTVKESLRAVDLAILRGGIEKWGNIAKNIVMKADKMLAVDIAVAATKTTSQQKRNDLPKVYLKNNPQCRDIPRIDGTTLSVEQFRDKYMLSSPSPVIITNAMSSWPALSRWQDVSYLKSRAASRLVPVETYAECDATQTYLSSSWEQRVMSVGEFIETHIERGGDGRTTDEGGSDRGYLAQYQLFDQIPSLRADICIPQYCHALTSADTEALSSQFNDDTRTGDDPLISAWLGPAGTVSPLHNDPYSNILAQVVGRKYLRLYDMRDTAKLYPRDGCQCNNSFVDVDDIDEHRFPLFSSAPSWQCVLESGEMLFIPRHWWHYVRSLNVSFSVSFWFGAKLGLIQNHSSGEYESRYF